MAVRRGQGAFPLRRSPSSKLEQPGKAVSVPRLGHPISALRMHRSIFFSYSLLSQRTLQSLYIIPHLLTCRCHWGKTVYRTLRFYFSYWVLQAWCSLRLLEQHLFVRVLKQAVSNVASTRKNTARDTLSCALSYGSRLCPYNLFTPQEFDNKPQELQVAKENVLKTTTDTTYALSCGRCAFLSSLTLTLRSLSHTSTVHTQPN